ncbi:hypothetical protein PLICRDRAFT_578939 [Plicaturopsis crispa FD-325 SS-3]|nr:hypothetical protein PLICRDRAFT_578939 [Plicaturopsis crispa FD-325 SS-3]
MGANYPATCCLGCSKRAGNASRLRPGEISAVRRRKPPSGEPCIRHSKQRRASSGDDGGALESLPTVCLKVNTCRQERCVRGTRDACRGGFPFIERRRLMRDGFMNGTRLETKE